MENKMYLVTVVREVTNDCGVEVVGIFDSEEKAYKAQAKVEKWMKDNDYDDYEIFVTHTEINCMKWYGLEEFI